MPDTIFNREHKRKKEKLLDKVTGEDKDLSRIVDRLDEVSELLEREVQKVEVTNQPDKEVQKVEITNPAKVEFPTKQLVRVENQIDLKEVSDKIGETNALLKKIFDKTDKNEDINITLDIK